MSNPAAPHLPDEPESLDTNEGARAPLPDIPHPFGPDAPNVREDDPPGAQIDPVAPPPSPPKTPLDDSDFAPDET